MFVNVSNIADISSTATYKLISSWSLWPLAVDPTQPSLQLRAQSNNDTPLEFQFRKSDELGKFNICAGVGGQTFCLDVYNEPKDLPHLTPWGYYAGQYWNVTPSDGALKLSNEWTGPNYYLDVYQGSLQAHMSTGDDYAGQYWMLDLASPNATLPPDAADTGSSSNAVSTPSSKGGDSLSTPAIIGISLGGGIFSAAFALAILALFFRRRRRRAKRLQQQTALAKGESPGNNRDHMIRSPDSRTNLDPNCFPGHACPTTPQQAHFGGLPPELESPVAMQHVPPNQYNNQRSIYELPASYEDEISVIRPKPSHHHSYPPDEKDAALMGSWPTSPASSTATAGLRANPRWEEVVPNGNGEITFQTIPRSISGSPPPQFSTIGTAPAGHFTRNIAGIAYGFGGGHGMAGGTAPGYTGIGVARDAWGNGTWSSDGRGEHSQSDSGEGASLARALGVRTAIGVARNERDSPGGASELDAQPPGYEGWPIYEVDGDRQHVYEAGGREVVRLTDLQPSSVSGTTPSSPEDTQPRQPSPASSLQQTPVRHTAPYRDSEISTQGLDTWFDSGTGMSR